MRRSIPRIRGAAVGGAIGALAATVVDAGSVPVFGIVVGAILGLALAEVLRS